MSRDAEKVRCVEAIPHFSPRIVARAFRGLQIEASAAPTDAGIVEHYVEEGGESTPRDAGLWTLAADPW